MSDHLHAPTPSAERDWARRLAVPRAGDQTQGAVDGRKRVSPIWTTLAAMQEMLLAAVAAGQNGAFTTADALAAGWTRRSVGRAHGSGRWKQLVKGAYVEQSSWDAMNERARHLCAVHAALLTRAPAWHAARRSAAVAHDLPLLGGLPPAPQLARQPLRTTDRSSSRHERLSSLPDHETAVRRNLRVTSLARTVIDLARSESFASAVVVADAALRRGLDHEELVAVAHRCERWPGGRQGVQVARFADGLAESPLESVSRASMRRCGIPIPELQVEVWVDGWLLARLDALWRRWNLVGEPDGRLKYRTTDAFYAEKKRQEALEDLGLQVVRWDWQTAQDRNGELEAKIRRGMERGARNHLDPRVRFVNTTVQDALARQEWHSRAA